MVRMLVAGALVGVAAAESVTDCGSSGDHLRITSLSLDADATGGPKKGQPFTITGSGTFDEAHTVGHVDVDLNLKALGIVNVPIPAATKYEFLPGLQKGDGTVTIGPITVPKSIPGSFELTGTVKIQNGNAEPVACISLDLKIPMIIEEEEENLAVSDDCTTASDHIQNIVSTTDASGVTTTTMDTDEDISVVAISGNIAVKVPILPAVKVTLPNIPISMTGVGVIPAGQLKFVDYGDDSQANDAITVTGQIKLSDGNGEQLTCIAIDADSSASSPVTV